MQPSVPVIDLTPWFSGGQAARAGVAAQVDAALQDVGFFLITGHGVPDELRARVRAQARAFFALPRKSKQGYAVTVGGRGWLPPGVEANGYAEGTETPPDMKESFAVGADQPTGDPGEVQPRPGAPAAGRGARRGSRLARLLLRGRPRRLARVAAAADRQAQRLRAGRVGAVPQDAPGRDHNRLVTDRPVASRDPAGRPDRL